MRGVRFGLAVGLVAVVGAAVALRAGTARAEDEKPGMPPPQKPVKQPFVDALLGSWTTTSKSPTWGTGKGKDTWALGVGGTAVVETYEHRTDGAPAEAAFHGFAVYKVSDDGKTITGWWFDTMSPEATKISGPLTDKGFDIQGPTAKGTLRVTLEKKGDALEFKMFMGGPEPVMSETRTRAK